jgi:CheY-like chemotaxis protein
MTIFWVDDDIKSFTRPYYEELCDEGYKDQIATFVEPDSALKYFKKHHTDLSCAIIDLMLPTGKSFSPEETELGTRTGKALITELQTIDEKIPIIILSVVRDHDIMDWVEEKKITYLTKSKTFPRDLLAKVREIERGKGTTSST